MKRFAIVMMVLLAGAAVGVGIAYATGPDTAKTERDAYSDASTEQIHMNSGQIASARFAGRDEGLKRAAQVRPPSTVTTYAETVKTVETYPWFWPVSGPSGADGTFNCEDFASQAAAQEYYNRQDGDPDGLDADGDGYACE